MISLAGASCRGLPPHILRGVVLQGLHTRYIRLSFNYIVKGFSTQTRSMASPSSGLTKPLTTTSIELTQRESQLRDLLLNVAHYIDESREVKERLELRFAGGWVRDKLLGIPSHDIDTAINVMTGYSFGLKMREYLQDPKNMKKHGLTKEDVGNLHKIAPNPEKSKHLETVTTKILGFDVDLVNLRKETYMEYSRNPQMEFGTAQEDAERRDTTVNALFYNLHTEEVEDYVGGLDDMKSKLIRTPLRPYETFKDDPLRVLRLIRFASRLSFNIHAESEACMGDPSILNALRLKISRERVGIEIEKMLKGPNPRSALQLIDRLGLYSTIFTNPGAEASPEPVTDRWRFAYDCLETLRSNESPWSIYKLLVRSDDAAKLAWLLAALCPWAEVAVPIHSSPGGKAPLPLATVVAREGIKANNRICDAITGAFRHREEISHLKKALVDQEPWVYERDKLGMMIRRWDARGGTWKSQVVLAILVEAMASTEPNGLEALLVEWQQFLDHLQEMEVLDADSWKRIIDGTQLAKALDVKPDKWMAAALDICMAWQFRNPNATDPAEAVEEVKRRAEELGIPLKTPVPIQRS